MQRIRYVALVATVVGGLSACSVYEDMTTSEFAKKDSDVIVAAASKAMRRVSSMRITGQVRARGTQVFVDVRVDRDGRCAGSIRLGGSNIDIRRVKSRAWITGQFGAFTRLSSSTPLPAATLQRLSTSWLLVDDRAVIDLCDFDELLAGFAVVDYGEDPRASQPSRGNDKEQGHGLPDDSVPATVGEESSIDDQTVVQLSGDPGGLHKELVWVRSDAPHYVVRVESTSARDGGVVSLSEFDQDVIVEPPDPADVFRP